MGSRILGAGSYFPSKLVLNDEIASRLETSDEWIKSRTGICQRYYASSQETNAYLAAEASKLALVDSGISKEDIDLVIVATTSPDYSFPSVASSVQSALHLGVTASFDLQAVCSGFIYGLHVADALLCAKKATNILLVGSEKMSSLLDFDDRSSSVLFGDGASAVILSASDSDSEIIDSIIYSDGEFFNILHSDGGVASTQTAGKLRMNGRETFKHAVQKMSDVCIEILNKNNISIDDIDHFVPHQANIRIIDSIRDRLNIVDEKIVKTIDRHANCSAASIPLAFDELKRSNKLKRGDLVLFVAFGAGFTWGAALLRY
jgi:3-oxoacyl-[acyl-carrier-protein] synthase-3